MKKDARLLAAFILIVLGLAFLIGYYFAYAQWIDAYYNKPWPGHADCTPGMTCFCFDCPTPKMSFQWTIIGFPMILVGGMLVLNSWWNPNQ